MQISYHALGIYRLRDFYVCSKVLIKEKWKLEIHDIPDWIKLESVPVNIIQLKKLLINFSLS